MKSPIPASISQVKTMARAVRIIVDSQELLTPAQTAELFTLYDKVGWFFFLDAPEAKIDTSSLPKIHLEDGEKSPSARMRAVLFLYWEQNKPTEDFETFYRNWMERTIGEVKSKLA